MTKKTNFPTITYTIEELPGCCGIGVVHYFQEENQYQWVAGKRVLKEGGFPSAKAQAEDCYDRFIADTWGRTEGYSTLLVSLVSLYGPDNSTEYAGKPQLPALHEKLVKEGWQKDQVFINPNHGNEVTLYSKHFPERNELEEDDDW